MKHIKCGSYVGIEITTIAVVAIHVGITSEEGKKFPVKVMDMYKRFARKINEDKIIFVCANCGIVEKEEVYSDCDYCSDKVIIDSSYIGTNVAGVFCKKCDKPKEYTLTKESLYERLKTNGLSLQ